MTRVIAALGEMSLVVRSPHPLDGRQVLVSVSNTGIGLLEAERRASQDWLQRRLAALDRDDRATLVRAAHLMSAIVDESA
jgi:DNA-binding MarR family transcriptional regulator